MWSVFWCCLFFYNSCRHQVGNHVWHSLRHRHVGPAVGHKSLESMSVFEQTLLDQTGQQNLVRCNRKNTDAAWKPNNPKWEEPFALRYFKDAWMLKCWQGKDQKPRSRFIKYVLNHVKPKSIIKQPQTCHVIFVLFNTEWQAEQLNYAPLRKATSVIMH